MQIYVDDVLTLINGTDDEKANLISLGLYTMKAFGVQIALGKGERGQQVQWIGVKMLLQWPESPLDGSILLSAEEDDRGDPGHTEIMANQGHGLTSRAEKHHRPLELGRRNFAQT